VRPRYMGWDVSKHSEPSRKRLILAKRIRRLKAAVKAGESELHVFKTGEKVRIAALTLIKAKRALLAEYPQSDPHGRRLRNLQQEEERWASLQIEVLINECLESHA
jgi:hypothetical protein